MMGISIPLNKGRNPDFFSTGITNNYEEIPWEFALNVWDSGIVFMVNSPYLTHIFHSGYSIYIKLGLDPESQWFLIIFRLNIAIYIYIYMGKSERPHCPPSLQS